MLGQGILLQTNEVLNTVTEKMKENCPKMSIFLHLSIGLVQPAESTCVSSIVQ